MPLYTEFVGIDVSKNKLDVYETKNKQYFTVTNDKKGIRSLLNHIKYNEQLKKMKKKDLHSIKTFRCKKRP